MVEVKQIEEVTELIRNVGEGMQPFWQYISPMTQVTLKRAHHSLVFACEKLEEPALMKSLLADAEKQALHAHKAAEEDLLHRHDYRSDRRFASYMDKWWEQEIM